MVIVRAASQQRERWRNGGGWTRPLARGRIDGTAVDGEDDWDWRLSIADIESDGPFSTFPGVDRVLVLLDGAGIELSFADGARQRLAEPLQSIRFAGERAVHCALLAGPTRDFNLMWRRERMRTALKVIDLDAAAAPLDTLGQLYALHVLSGTLRVQGALAATGDTVLSTDGGAVEAVVCVPGQALLVRGDRR